MLDLSSFDLEESGNALADQTDYEHRWLTAASCFAPGAVLTRAVRDGPRAPSG